MYTVRSYPAVSVELVLAVVVELWWPSLFCCRCGLVYTVRSYPRTSLELSIDCGTVEGQVCCSWGHEHGFL